MFPCPSGKFISAMPAITPSAMSLPVSKPKAMEQVEGKWIRQAYQMTGSIIGTAKLLGINPSTIHRKLKKRVLSLD